MLRAATAMRVSALCSLRQPIAASAGEGGGRSSGVHPTRSRGSKSSSARVQQARPLSTSSSAAAPGGVAAEAGLECDPAAPHPHRSINVLSSYRALLLDSTYRPVGVANWQRAICLDLLDKADVLEYYDHSVRSVQLEYYLPAVLRVRWRNRNPHKLAHVTLNRSNIMLRDRYSCQYCGSSKELTIDHVVPQSKGGGNTWQNLVACCACCNSKKGDKLLEQLRWKLKQQPKEPSTHEMEFVLSMLMGSTNQDKLPPEWQAYILPFKSSKKKKQASS